MRSFDSLQADKVMAINDPSKIANLARSVARSDVVDFSFAFHIGRCRLTFYSFAGMQRKLWPQGVGGMQSVPAIADISATKNKFIPHLTIEKRTPGGSQLRSALSEVKTVCGTDSLAMVSTAYATAMLNKLTEK